MVLGVFLMSVLAGCAIQLSSTLMKTHVRGECVVLVHGLWRSGAAMSSIETFLSKQGYDTIAIDYPSTRKPIPILAEQYLGAQGVDECMSRGAEKIHLVTHSMGGILARQYLQSNRLPPGSRIVMLSPPNQGSELSRTFSDAWWFDWVVGPAGGSLTQEGEGIIHRLKPITAPVGIIAAYRDWSLWPDGWLPAPNDGTVSVQSMVLEEMDDFILVNSGHAMMRSNETVHSQIGHFLESGRFLAPVTAGQEKWAGE